MESLFQTVEHISPLLSGHVEQEELDGRLSKEVTDTLKKSGLYKLFLPFSLGGLEADPVTAAKLIEQISRYNAAAAWSVMVACAGAWWCKYLPAETAEEVFIRSSENFMAKSKIDLWKFRLSYGLSGNDDIGNYTSRQTYGSQNLLGMQV